MVGSPPSPLKISPVFVSLGDYNNVLFIRQLIHKGGLGPVDVYDESILLNAFTGVYESV